SAVKVRDSISALAAARPPPGECVSFVSLASRAARMFANVRSGGGGIGGLSEVSDCTPAGRELDESGTGIDRIKEPGACDQTCARAQTSRRNPILPAFAAGTPSSLRSRLDSLFPGTPCRW